MTAIVRAGSVFSTTAGNKATAALTVAANDLIFLFLYNTGRTTAQVPGSITDDNGGAAYTQVFAATKNGSADSMWGYVRNSLLGSAASTIFSFTQASDTGGGIEVIRVTGMSRTGLSAIKQFKKADNQATGTPSITMDAAVDTANSVVGSVFTTQTGTTNTAPPSGWTEDIDAGYSTPSTGREVAHRDSGETNTTIAWTAATTSAFCAAIVEFDASSAGGGGATNPGWYQQFGGWWG